MEIVPDRAWHGNRLAACNHDRRRIVMNNRVSEVVPEENPSGHIEFKNASDVKGWVSAPTECKGRGLRRLYDSARIAVESCAKFSKKTKSVPSLSAFDSRESLG